MMRHRAVYLAVGSCLLASWAVMSSCGSSLPDADIADCTQARLSAVATGCQYRLPGDVLGAQCAGLVNSAAALDAGNYGVRACQAEKAGRMITCLADNVAQCAYEMDAGIPVSVASQCAYQFNPTAPTPDPTCAQTCASTRQNCENACPTTSAQVCYNCSFNCGSAQVQCLSKCPAAK